MKEFKPQIRYDADGDVLEVYFKDDSSYGEWLSPSLTLFRSQETDEVVGLLVEGAMKIIMRAPEARTPKQTFETNALIAILNSRGVWPSQPKEGTP